MELTRELLNEVLDIRKNCEYLHEEAEADGLNECIVIGWDGEDYFDVNIHELAHKCKEWARDKYDCTISSSIYKEYSKCWAITLDESFVAPTEPEAIFQACQWILDNNELLKR
jgi:hypothetical protein